MVKIKVTQETFDEHFSIEEWFNFSKLSNIELYEKMLLFVVDENDNPVTIEQARTMFKKVSKKEWPEYVKAFFDSVRDAFVSPTSGGS